MQQQPEINESISGSEKNLKQKKSIAERTQRSIIMILILIALACFFWIYQQIAALKKELAETTKKMTWIQETSTDIQNQLYSQAGQLEKLQQSKSESTLERDHNKDLVDLIRLAQQYLTIQKNIPSAIQSLLLAKEQANMGGDEKGQELQNEINQIIQALEAIKLPDHQQLIKQLSMLSETINPLLSIPIASSKDKPKNTHSADSINNSSESYWQRLKITFITLINKAVVIQKETSTDLATLYHSIDLVSQLRFSLLRAQWAIIQQQDAAFKESIDEALRLLRQMPEQEKQQAISSLEEIKKISINPTLPDVSHLIERITSTENRPRAAPPKPSQEIPAVQEGRVLSS